MNLKIVATVGLLITINPLTAFGQNKPGTINTQSGCYMEVAPGKIVDLTSLCGTNNNSFTNTNYRNSSYTTPNYYRPTRNYNTGFTQPTPTKSRNYTDINEAREQIDNQMFGGLNNGYNTNGACVNQANTSNYSSWQCGGDANSSRRYGK